ncbi:hypothetical protein FKP32DRAFT_1679103 [Trametes sanguinea]|nr:hypothetical protein FKP32DRAFT_1679103 [Trametes sanguinea]
MEDSSTAGNRSFQPVPGRKTAKFGSREFRMLMDEASAKLETSLESACAEHVVALVAVHEEHSEMLGAKEEALHPQTQTRRRGARLDLAVGDNDSGSSARRARQDVHEVRRTLNPTTNPKRLHASRTYHQASRKQEALTLALLHRVDGMDLTFGLVGLTGGCGGGGGGSARRCPGGRPG